MGELLERARGGDVVQWGPEVDRGKKRLRLENSGKDRKIKRHSQMRNHFQVAFKF